MEETLREKEERESVLIVLLFAGNSVSNEMKAVRG
jgi:hypothetical protein